MKVDLFTLERHKRMKVDLFTLERKICNMEIEIIKFII